MLSVLQISQKNFTLSTFPSSNRRNFEDSGKVLAVSVSILPEQYYSSALPAYAYKMVITSVCVQIDNCFCNTRIVVHKVISWHAFVSHLGMFSKIK